MREICMSGSTRGRLMSDPAAWSAVVACDETFVVLTELFISALLYW